MEGRPAQPACSPTSKAMYHPGILRVAGIVISPAVWRIKMGAHLRYRPYALLFSKQTEKSGRLLPLPVMGREKDERLGQMATSVSADGAGFRA
jgi:hypothetical protein